MLLICYLITRYNFYFNRDLYSHWSSRRFPSDRKSGCDADHWGSFGTLDGALCHRGEIPSKQNILM